MNLGEQVVVVTGGSRGIGRSCALQAAQLGARVVFCARHDGDELRAVEAEAAAGGMPGAVIGVRADVTREDDVAGVFEAARREFGAVTSVVSNAASSSESLLVTMETASWDAVMATNLTGGFLVARCAIRAFVEQRVGGRLVLLGTLSQNGVAGNGAYAASKGGALGLTRADRTAVWPTGHSREHGRAGLRRNGALLHIDRPPTAQSRRRMSAPPPGLSRRNRGCGHVPAIRRGPRSERSSRLCVGRHAGDAVMTAPFTTTVIDDGVLSLQVATDDECHMDPQWSQRFVQSLDGIGRDDVRSRRRARRRLARLLRRGEPHGPVGEARLPGRLCGATLSGAAGDAGSAGGRTRRACDRRGTPGRPVVRRRCARRGIVVRRQLHGAGIYSRNGRHRSRAGSLRSDPRPPASVHRAAHDGTARSAMPAARSRTRSTRAPRSATARWPWPARWPRPRARRSSC